MPAVGAAAKYCKVLADTYRQTNSGTGKCQRWCLGLRVQACMRTAARTDRRWSASSDACMQQHCRCGQLLVSRVSRSDAPLQLVWAGGEGQGLGAGAATQPGIT